MVLELKKLSKDEKIKQQLEARADYESRIATAKGAGIALGEDKLARLISVLISLNRNDDVNLALSDKKERDRLYIELGIVD